MKYIIMFFSLVLICNNVLAASLEENIENNSLNLEFIDKIWTYLAIVMSVVVVFVSIKILRKELKNKNSKQNAIELKTYPPMDKNSAEIGYIYKGAADFESVMSLLIHLANKGYIKIKPEVETKMLVKQPGFRITKLKEYDGDDENEKRFMEGLFENKKIIRSKAYEIIKEGRNIDQDIKYEDAFKQAEELYSSQVCNEVTYYDLRDCFDKVERSIRENINSRGIRKDKVISKSQLILYLLALIVFIFSTIMIAHKALPEEDNWMAPYIFVGIFGLPVVLISHKEKVTQHIDGEVNKRKRKSNKMFYTLWLGVVLAITGYILLFGKFIPTILEIISVILGIITTIVAIYCAQNVPINNDILNGNEELENIMGFIKFLNAVDKENLEVLIRENPNYCYDIYQYVYSLGMTDVWIEKFENVALNAPDWCEGFDNFNIREFNDFIHMVIRYMEDD